jgi:hypothetical protein
MVGVNKYINKGEDISGKISFSERASSTTEIKPLEFFRASENNEKSTIADNRAEIKA